MEGGVTEMELVGMDKTSSSTGKHPPTLLLFLHLT